MTHEEFLAENIRLGHAIQSAIAYKMNFPGYGAASPKHMRVGVDTTKAEHGALTRLLVDKGIITEQEYFASTIDGYERELEFQTDEARRLSGINNLSFG